MEIRIDNPEQGIVNYQPLIAWAKERASTYEGLIVQEDSISSAKADAADLRKLAKAASDYRIQIKKDHEAKIAETINQLKELTDIFNTAADKISAQVNAFAEKEKQDKQYAIIDYWNEHVGDLHDLVSISHEKIWDEKWLNKSTSMEIVHNIIDDYLTKIHESLDSIRGMGSVYENEMIAEYLRTLDMNKAMQRRKMLEEQAAKLAEMKARQEAEKQQMTTAEYKKEAPAPEPKELPMYPNQNDLEVIDIRIFVTAEQKAAFRNFLRSSGIKYCSVPKK